MSEKLLGAILWIGVIVALFGCGGGEKKTGGSGEPGTKADTSASTSLESTPAVRDTTPTPTGPRYNAVDDPKATYTRADLPVQGSYLKLDLTELNPGQLNRAVHRLRSEYCTCGCEKDTIDQCLVNDPSCNTAITLANQIIREEKLKS